MSAEAFDKSVYEISAEGSVAQLECEAAFNCLSEKVRGGAAASSQRSHGRAEV